MDSISEILQGFEFASAHTQTFSAGTTKIEGGFSRLFQDLFGKTTIKTEYNKQKETDDSKSFDGFSPFVTNHDLTATMENRFRESFADRIRAEQTSATDKANQSTSQKKVNNKSKDMAQAVKNTTEEKPEAANTKKETAETKGKTDNTSSEPENRKKADPNETGTNNKVETGIDNKVETGTNKNEREVSNNEKTTANSEAENTEIPAPTVTANATPEIEVPTAHAEPVPTEAEESTESTAADIEKNTSTKTEVIPSTEQTEQTETNMKVAETEPKQEQALQRSSESAEQQIITTDLTDNEPTETSLNIEMEKSANPDAESLETSQTKTENNNQDPIKIENPLPVQEEKVETNTPQIIPAENTEKTTTEKQAGENTAQVEAGAITDKLMKFATLLPEKLLEEPEFRELMVNLVDKIRELAESTGLAEQIETETTISTDEFFDLLKDYFENPQPEKLANLEKTEFSQWHKLADTLKDYSILQWSTESVETDTINNALRKISPDLNPLTIAENMSAEDIARMNAVARMALKINHETPETQNTKEPEITSPETEIVEENPEKQQDNSSDKREHHHNSSDFLSASTKTNSTKTEKTAPKFTVTTETHNTSDKIETALNKGRENSLSGTENTSESARTLSKSPIRGFATESNLLVKQIMEQAKKLNPPKLNTIRIILKPENLGQLRLSVSKETNSDSFRVSFATETTAAKEMIERNINQIRESLKNQGINANSIDVELNGENEKRNFSHRGAKKKKWGKTKVETIETGAPKEPEAMSENIVNRYA